MVKTMSSFMKRTFAGNIEITLNPSQTVTRMGADRLTNGSLEPAPLASAWDGPKSTSSGHAEEGTTDG